MNRDPILDADWTLVGTSNETDSTHIVCGLRWNEVDGHVKALTENGWDVHVYEPVLKQIIPGEHNDDD